MWRVDKTPSKDEAPNMWPRTLELKTPRRSLSASETLERRTCAPKDGRAVRVQNSSHMLPLSMASAETHVAQSILQLSWNVFPVRVHSVEQVEASGIEMLRESFPSTMDTPLLHAKLQHEFCPPFES